MLFLEKNFGRQSYRKAEEILHIEIIELIQQYVDGENIYIPRKSSYRQAWGTEIKLELLKRDKQIYDEYLAGSNIAELACKYYLSEKSIQRILRIQKYS
ncbi:hypothetical protein D3Z60_11805 [Lachnospiraceae bacterium]|jgi:Mor family transcriptional regulator|nr:hypothetical protein [Lachnospiraceae bacterium]